MAPSAERDPARNSASAPSVSVLLRRIREGDDRAREDLFATIQWELRELARDLMARESADHTLQATALVNEAFLKLEQAGLVTTAESRRHLFGSAARAMRQVLVDHARRRSSAKRGGDLRRHELDIVLDRFEVKHAASFLDLEVALERLREESEREYETLMLRFFAGLSVPEVAELMGHSVSTAEADWRFARAKLHTWLKEQ